MSINDDPPTRLRPALEFCHQRAAQRDSFQPNSLYDRLLNLYHSNRAAYDSLSPAMKLALLEYDASKRQAAIDAEMRK